MKIAGYSFKNFKTFRGREDTGLECDIYKGRKKFAYYHYDGNGGEGFVKTVYNGDEKKFRENISLTGTFVHDALKALPRSEKVWRTTADLDAFFIRAYFWHRYEKNIKSLKHVNPNAVFVFVIEEENGQAYTGLCSYKCTEDMLVFALKDKYSLTDKDRLYILPAETDFNFSAFPENVNI